MISGSYGAKVAMMLSTSEPTALGSNALDLPTENRRIKSTSPLVFTP